MHHLPPLGRRGACWDREGRSPGLRVSVGVFDEPDEVVVPILVVGDTEEEGIKYFAEGGQIVVGRLAGNGCKGSGGGGEEGGDLLRRHGVGEECEVVRVRGRGRVVGRDRVAGP